MQKGTLIPKMERSNAEKSTGDHEAYDDPEFLHGQSARSIRVLSEFIQPEEASEERNPQHNRILRIGARHA